MQPVPISTALPHAVRSLRRAAGMSQDALAEKAGINAETISRIENGLTTTSKTLSKLVAVLPDLSRFILGDPSTDTANASTVRSANLEHTGASMESEDLKALKDSVCAIAQGLNTRAALLSARGHLITLLREEQHKLDEKEREKEKPTLVHSSHHRPRQKVAG